MGMYTFNPDDPSSGVFGTGSAQHVAKLWKNNIGDTPQPHLHNVKEVRNSTAKLSKNEYGLSEKKNQQILNLINSLSICESDIRLSSDHKSIYDEGVRKLKNAITYNDILTLEDISQNPDVKSEVKKTALALIYLSGFNKDNPMSEAAGYIHYLTEALDTLNKHHGNEEKYTNLCHLLSNTVFDEIALKFGKRRAEKMDIEIYEKHVIAAIDKSIRKMNTKPSKDQVSNYKRVINEKYQNKMSCIMYDTSLNKLTKFYHRINYTLLLSEYIQSIMVSQNKKGVEKCQVL